MADGAGNGRARRLLRAEEEAKSQLRSRLADGGLDSVVRAELSPIERMVSMVSRFQCHCHRGGHVVNRPRRVLADIFFFTYEVLPVNTAWT